MNFKEYREKKNDKSIVDISHHKTTQPPKKDKSVVDISHHKEKQKPIKESEDAEDEDHPFHYDHEEYGDEGYLKNLEHEHANNINHDEHESLHGYVNGGLVHGLESGSREINNFLIDAHRKGKQFDPSKKTFHYHDTDPDSDNSYHVNLGHLDSAIAKNKHEHGMTTYSGLGFDPKDHVVQKHLTMPGYTSSQAKLDVAKTYAKYGQKHILAIHHPAGSTGFYMGDNDDITPFGQAEHLAPRGMKLKLADKPTTSKDGYHIWHAERVN